MIGEIIGSVISALIGPFIVPIVAGAAVGGFVGWIGSKIFKKKKAEPQPELIPEYQICHKVQQENFKNCHPQAKLIKEQHEAIKRKLRKAKENQMTDREIDALVLVEEKQRKGTQGRKNKNPFPPLSVLRRNPAVIISRGSNGRPIVTIDIDLAEELNCVPVLTFSSTENTMFPPEGQPCIYDALFSF